VNSDKTEEGSNGEAPKGAAVASTDAGPPVARGRACSSTECIEAAAFKMAAADD